MAPFHTRTVAFLLAGLTLTAVPAFAQQSGRDNGRENRREAAARVPPRARGESVASVAPQPQTNARQRAESQQPQRAESQQRVDARPSAGSQQRSDSRQRAGSSAAVAPRSNGNDSRAYGNRASDSGRYDNHRYDDHRYDNHRYDDHHYDNHSIWRPYYPTRTYVVPYGYRPYGYRPGWSLNFYFGRPYGYGYPSGYGYYALRPGLAYGALRIVDAPRDAHVLVDGFYAGVVDDYDGVFQHLNLEAGTHGIELEAAGYPPIAFDVKVLPGQTITYRANLD